MSRKFFVIIYIYCICCCYKSVVSAQDIVITKDFGEVLLKDTAIEEQQFRIISVEGCNTRSSEVGKADLPVCNLLLNIPNDESVKLKYDIIKQDTLYIDGNTHIMPRQHSQSKQNEDIDFVFNKEYYSLDGFYKHNTVNLISKGKMGRNDISILNINPVSYNPKTNCLIIIKQIQITISQNNTNEQRNNENHIINHFNYFTQSKTYNNNHIVQNSLAPYKMVIISDREFEHCLQSFVEWKKQQGYYIIEAYTDSVGFSKEDIKQYLSALYNSCGSYPPDYLLIVGDTEHIPSFEGNFALIDNYYTDFYYAEHTQDMLPDMFYGRISAEDTAQLNNIIAKTIAYESYRFDDDNFLNRCLLIAGYEREEPAPTLCNGQVNYAKQYFQGLDTTAYYNYYIPGQYNENTDTINISVQRNLDLGQGFVNYSGHCIQEGWYRPMVRNSFVDTIKNNGMFGVFINNCCLSGKFSNGESFSESLLRKANGGAVGVIGASGYTYWQEDYCWAVGNKTATGYPIYDSDNTGMYDRLFHTGNEALNERFITMGQMIVAGNLAVTQSMSEYADSYWEMYNLQGDPSLMPFVGRATEFEKNFPDTVYLSANTLSFTTIPYTYISLSTPDTMIAVHADSTGDVVLDISHIIEPQDAIIVLSKQFHKPLIDTVRFVPPMDRFIALKNITFSDSGQSNTSHLTTNNYYNVSFTAMNNGLSPTNGTVEISVSVQDGNITLLDSIENINPLNPLTETVVNDGFSFKTSDYTENGHSVRFVFTIKSADYSRNQSVYYIFTAEDLDITGIYSDIHSDTIFIHCTALNQGKKDSGNGTIHIYNTGDSITVLQDSFDVEALSPMETEQKTFILLKQNNYTYDTLNFKLSYSAGLYQKIKQVTLNLNNLKETFDNYASDFAWNNDCCNLWQKDSLFSVSGGYSLRSKPNLSPGQKSEISISMNVMTDDTLSFYVRLRTEKGFDFLNFYIDNQKQTSLTGEIDWQQNKFPVNHGYHTFKWSFDKDASNDYYIPSQEGVWLDDIVFPISGGESFLQDNITKNHIVLYPNPAGKTLKIENTEYGNNIFIVDINGRYIYGCQTEDKTTEINTQNFSQGIYYVIINNGKGEFTEAKKLIINR